MTPRPYYQMQLHQRRKARTVFETVLIVCEGAKTESLYFKGLRGKLRIPTVSVKVCGKECGSAPINVVDYAIERCLEYDHCWCVMDVETPRQHKTLKEALQLVRDTNAALKNTATDEGKTAQKIQVALSNPCFEFWYILHFEKITKAFDNNPQVRKRLKQHIPRYGKGKTDVFAKLFPLIRTAVKNADQVLKEKQCTKHLQNHNPSTHVQNLVKQIYKIAGKEIE